MACVPDAAALEAVNAVIQETFAPASTFIVSDRAAAADTLAHLKSARAGLATCLIASEATQHSSRRLSASGTRLAPLLDDIQAQASLGDCVQAVFRTRLGGWYVAEDRNAALAEMARIKAQRSAAPSIVTLQGELFKADGEVICQGNPQRSVTSSQAYLLSTSIKPLGQPTCCFDPAQRAAMEKDHRDWLAKLTEEEAALTAQCEEAEGQLSALREQSAAKQAELGRVDRQSTAGTRLEGQRRAVTVAERELARAHAQAEGAREKAAEQHARLETARQAAVQARATWKAACMKLQGGEGLLAAHNELAKLKAQQAAAQHSCQEAQQTLRKITRRLAALQSPAQAAEGAPGRFADELAVRALQLAGRVAELTVQALRTRTALKEAKGRAVDAEEQSQAATRYALPYWLACNFPQLIGLWHELGTCTLNCISRPPQVCLLCRQCHKAAKAVCAAREALQSTQAGLLEQQRRAQQVQAALAELRLSPTITGDACKSAGEPEGAAGAVDAPRKGVAGSRRVILSDSEDDADDGRQEGASCHVDEDSSSEVHVLGGADQSEEGSGLGYARAGTHGGRRSVQGRIWDEGQIEQMEAELHDEEGSLKVRSLTTGHA